VGNALSAQGKLDDALAAYRRARELEPDFIEACYNMSLIFKSQGRLQEALACSRQALQLQPEYPNAHGTLGDILMEMGDHQGAEDAFRAALRHQPRLALAYYKLTELLGRNLPAEDLAALRQLLDERVLPDAEQLLLHFGLAQALDARGQYAPAAEHMAQGNALRRAERHRQGQTYDPRAYELLVTHMRHACTAEFFAHVRGYGLESQLPVFIVGLPRSGTTLLEQILASHSQVCGAGELKLGKSTMAALGGTAADPCGGLRQLDRPTAQRLANRHLEQLRALHPTARRIVDKMPENYIYLGLLGSLFPRARFIHCRRDLRDVAVSCWMTHFQDIRWANEPGDIATRFAQYQRIMEHWRQVLPVPLLEIDYEQTVADLEGTARRLVAWCGLDWEPGCLEYYRSRRPVRTASVLQVRQPIYSKSVARWKHYESALGELFAQVTPPAAKSVDT